MSETAEFEVWQDDMIVASESGPREDAMREAMHYVSQYQQDVPVTVFEVKRIPVPYVTIEAQTIYCGEV